MFAGYRLPYWNEVRELVKNVHAKLPDIKSIGWDVAITENGPILVEGNPSCQLNLIEYIGLNKKEGRRKIIEPFLDEKERS